MEPGRGQFTKKQPEEKKVKQKSQAQDAIDLPKNVKKNFGNRPKWLILEELKKFLKSLVKVLPRQSSSTTAVVDQKPNMLGSTYGKPTVR